MPTAYKDQFYVMDPGVPPAGGTALTVERYEFIDENDDGQITSTSADTIEGDTITQVWVNDTVTVNVPGVGNVTYTGVTFYTDGVPSLFTPNDGQILQDGTFVSSTFVTTATQTPVGVFGPTCFTPGTLIDVPGGRRPVEALRPGDMVLTRDRGAAPVRRVLARRYAGRADAAPVIVEAGALGDHGRLVLSQQHRVLIDDARAELWFGHREMFAAIAHLVNGASIRIEARAVVHYYHLVFDRHEIVTAQGLAAESYHLRHAVRPGLPRCGIPVGVADMLGDAGAGATGPARPVLRAREARLFTPMVVQLPNCA